MAVLQRIWKYLCSLHYHSFAVGLGSLLLGVGGFMALLNTDTVLEKMTSIQDTVNNLREAVDNLRAERKEVTTLKRLPVYKEFFSLKEEDKDKKSDFFVQGQEQALKELLPDENSNLKAGDIYLHSKALPLLKEKLASNDQRANLRAERFLKENLQIWSPNDKGKKN